MKQVPAAVISYLRKGGVCKQEVAMCEKLVAEARNNLGT
jgi:hypothetical protein